MTMQHRAIFGNIEKQWFVAFGDEPPNNRKEKLMIGYAIVEKYQWTAEPIIILDECNTGAAIWMIYTNREDAEGFLEVNGEELGIVEVRIEANKRVELN